MKPRPLALVFVALIATGLATAAEPSPIDLPTALRLAGADNLDVQIAREQVAEAGARQLAARDKFFPWLTPSVTLRRHENNSQTVDGTIIDADKQSLAAGLTLSAQIDFGGAYYDNLAAKQLVRASEAALAGRQREMTYRAAAAYFELARARAAVGASAEAARVATEHARQVAATTEAGLSFQGDAARIIAARERSALTLSRLRAEQRAAAARLAELLRLDPAVELVPQETDLVPLTLMLPGEELGTLVARALAKRPELDQASARLAASRALQRGAKYGPLVPTLGAQVGYGGLGGATGTSSFTQDFDTSEDYVVGLSWRVGPGGIGDRSRLRETAARTRLGELELEKTRDGIRRQVVELHARWQSLTEQVELARKSLEASDQTARLSRERRSNGVSAVLEDLQAEDALAQARRDYLAVVADYNQAQYALRYALGE